MIVSGVDGIGVRASIIDGIEVIAVKTGEEIATRIIEMREGTVIETRRTRNANKLACHFEVCLKPNIQSDLMVVT